MEDRLTHDAVPTIYANPAAVDFHPSLQVIHKKIISDTPDRYCLVLSDGHYCISGLLTAPQIAADDSSLQKIHLHCIVQLTAFSPKFVCGTMILQVDHLVHLSCATTRLGAAHPTYYELQSTSMSKLLQAQLNLLAFKQHQHRALAAAVHDNARKAAEEMITLNIGGQRFQTASSNLLRHASPSYFTYMLAASPRPAGNEYFIDVDPIHFDRVMAHLRTGDALSYDGLSLWETLQLRKTVRYLGLDAYCTSTDTFMEHMHHLSTTTTA
ncbi:Aste57867_21517 [Aphanomyces stellatus]|uniref:Aste57867_21517 protein n=1 Tax=Aphanomyces stellatus TaxID=120398 RepID=A0A485LIC8_9STRA|nr:hypothetical protein As57867_021448 [Aphanomyces stellatus]VFT98187.1 Aste57867_21517 [Aphanomyces stellatus]